MNYVNHRSPMPMPPAVEAALIHVPKGQTPLQAMQEDAARIKARFKHGHHQNSASSVSPVRQGRYDGDRLRAIRAEIMKTPKSFSARDIADALDSDPRGIAAYLQILRKEGFVEVVSRATSSAPTDWRVAPSEVAV